MCVAAFVEPWLCISSLGEWFGPWLPGSVRVTSLDCTCCLGYLLLLESWLLESWGVVSVSLIVCWWWKCSLQPGPVAGCYMDQSSVYYLRSTRLACFNSWGWVICPSAFHNIHDYTISIANIAACFNFVIYKTELLGRWMGHIFCDTHSMGS